MVIIFGSDILAIIVFVVCALLLSAGAALQAVLGAVMVGSLILETILAIVFFRKSKRCRDGVESGLSILSSVLCLLATFFVLNRLRRFGPNFGDTILFTVEALFFGGAWLLFVFNGWLGTNLIAESDEALGTFKYEAVVSVILLALTAH